MRITQCCHLRGTARGRGDYRGATGQVRDLMDRVIGYLEPDEADEP
jgi:hypothetical protein